MLQCEGTLGNTPGGGVEKLTAKAYLFLAILYVPKVGTCAIKQTSSIASASLEVREGTIYKLSAEINSFLPKSLLVMVYYNRKQVGIDRVSL